MLLVSKSVVGVSYKCVCMYLIVVAAGITSFSFGSSIAEQERKTNEIRWYDTTYYYCCMYFASGGSILYVVYCNLSQLSYIMYGCGGCNYCQRIRTPSMHLSLCRDSNPPSSSLIAVLLCTPSKVVCLRQILLYSYDYSLILLLDS